MVLIQGMNFYQSFKFQLLDTYVYKAVNMVLLQLYLMDTPFRAVFTGTQVKTIMITIQFQNLFPKSKPPSV